MFTVQDAVANTATTTLEAVRTGQTLVLDAVNTMGNLVPGDLGLTDYLPAQLRAVLPADTAAAAGLAPREAAAQYVAYLDSMFDFGAEMLELNKSFALSMLESAESFRAAGRPAAPFTDGMAALQSAFSESVQRAATATATATATTPAPAAKKATTSTSTARKTPTTRTARRKTSKKSAG